MRQSRLFSSMLLSFMVIVLFCVSHLSASVTFWDDFDSAPSGDNNSLYRWEDNSTIPVLDPDGFDIYKILSNNDFMQLYWNQDEIYAHVIFRDVLIDKTFLFMPDDFLTQQIFSKALGPDNTSEWRSGMRPASRPADDMVFENDADYNTSMGTPAPGSLLLVAVGLLSLRFTRRLRY